MDPEYGECYKFADESPQMNYDNATAYCISKNGHLTDILNQQTQNFLVENIPSGLEFRWLIGGKKAGKVGIKYFILLPFLFEIFKLDF